MMKLIIIWFVAKFLDFITTIDFVKKFGWGEESNPLMILSYQRLGWAGIILGTLGIGILIYLCQYLAKRVGGKIGQGVGIFLWIFVLFNLLVGVWNLIV